MTSSDHAPSRVLAKNPALASFTITLILFSIQLFFIRPFFLVNDDIFKVLMVKGINASGQASPFMGYSNILLGHFLKTLYGWRQTFPWYGWFLCLTQFASFWAVLWLSLRRSSTWARAFLFIGAWACVYFFFFVFLQFTMTALLAAESALLIFLLPGAEEKPSTGLWALGAALLWLSAGVRMDSLELAFLLAAPLLVLRLADPRWRVFMAGKKFFLITAAGGLLFLGLFQFFWFQNNADWKQYRDFDQARVALQDYHVPSYNEKTKPLFDAVGWSENDLWLFKNWYFTNPAKFNQENFQKIAAAFPGWGSEGKTASFHSLEELVLSNWDRRILLAFVLLLVFCPAPARKILFVQLLWTLGLFAGLIYFLRAPDRVTLPVLAFSLSWALIEAGSFSFSMSKGTCWAQAALLAAALVLGLPSIKDYYHQDLQRQEAEKTLESYLLQAQPRPDQLYVIWSFPLEGFGAFNDMECLRPFPLWVSSFSQTSPASLKGLEKFGVKEPLRDAVDNPKVLVLCSVEEGVRYYQYMLENFHQKIYARLVFKCGAFSAYSIHSRKGK